MMKILLVSQEYMPENRRGGIGTQTFLKAKGLANRGHQVFIICRSIDNNPHIKSDNNITEIAISGMENVLPEMTYPLQWLTHSIGVAAEINRIHYEIGI